MKKQIKADKPTPIEGADPTKTSEREFGQAMESMVDLMSRIYRNQVIEELNKSTVEKFSDAQPGNYAAAYLTLAKRVKRKLLKRFDDKRIEKLARKYLEDVNERNRTKLYSRIEKAIGIDEKQLIAQEGLKARTNAMILETAQWAKKLRDDTLEQYTANALRVMSQGATIEEVLSEFDGMAEKRKNHAKMVARTQISTFNSVMTKVRAQNLGIDKAVWVTASDERVRGKPGGKYPNAKPSHDWANGKEFDLSEGLKFPSGDKLLPGATYNCRCTYRLIIPGDEE